MVCQGFQAVTTAHVAFKLNPCFANKQRILCKISRQINTCFANKIATKQLPTAFYDLSAHQAHYYANHAVQPALYCSCDQVKQDKNDPREVYTKVRFGTNKHCCHRVPNQLTFYTKH